MPDRTIEELERIVQELERENDLLRRSRDLLCDRERDLLTIVTNTPAPIYLKDRDLRYILVNKRYEQLAHVGVDALRGLTDYDIFPKDVADVFRVQDEEVMRLGEPREFEESIPLPDGTFTFITVKFPVFDAAGHLHAVGGFCTDITARRAFEAKLQQMQKLESLGVLAGGIAHDFNNLLTAILGNIDLSVLKLPPASIVRPRLLEASKASQRAADLCRQMLAYSGKGRFVVETVDLNALIEEMGRMLEVSISKKVVVRYNFAGDLRTVQADTTQLRQVIMNIVINASEASGDRGGEVVITTGCEYCDREYLDGTWLPENLQEGSYVFVEVSDTGCGMNRATMETMFDPFFTTKFTGRGLGLAAVLGIVRGHGGAIKVDSEIGRGTTFKVLFPANGAPDETVVRSAECGERWSASGTVLLVDDDESVRLLGADMLEHGGFSVVTASGGREATKVFGDRAEEIACVILDLTMPDMDGEETFRELRLVHRDVPVIMSSGYSEQEVIERFAGKGPVGFLQKPYCFEDIMRKLKSVLKAGSVESSEESVGVGVSVGNFE